MERLIQRDIDILSALVSEYISTAAPVGSAAIAKAWGIGLSTASIRNVLAKLEEMGLLAQPHTSAGRVPTNPGLRFYVNTILNQRELSEKEKAAISGQFDRTPSNTEDILRRANKILSLISNYTGLVVLPKVDRLTLKHMEFLPLTTGKCLGIFVSREGIVHNRVIDIGEDFTYPDLEKISNYCNTAFYGHSLEDAAKKISKEMEKAQSRYDRLIGKALFLAGELLDESATDELLVHGEAKLLTAPEFADVKKLREVMDALEEKKGLLHLLERAAEGDDVCVFIGSESNYSAMTNCSIVTTRYKKADGIVGTLGVIGPTRMDYSKVIPTVDFTAKIVNELLNT
jgi:heat-inducible transcriptional repressor